MPSFTTRVELHDADSDDYTKLHKEMRKEGFSRTVTGKSDREYQLQPGEYDYYGDDSRQEVLGKAKSAAGEVKGSYSVLVTKSAGRSWYNLNRV